MPTALAMDRTRVCTYTFENSSKCRIPLTSHPYLCTFHARKDAENRAADEAVRDIAFHLSNRYVSHCDLSAAIAQTITAVAYNHIPTRTAATIAYLTQNLVQTLAGAEKEFKDTFGIYAWRQTIANNFNTPRLNNPAVRPSPTQPAASNPNPAPSDDRNNDPASTAATDPQILSAQPPREPEQASAESSTENEAQNEVENNSQSGDTSSSESSGANNPERAAAIESQTSAESSSQSDGTANSEPHASSDAQTAAEYDPAPAPSATTAPAPPPRTLEPHTHLPSQPQIEAALSRLRAAMATQ